MKATSAWSWRTAMVATCSTTSKTSSEMSIWLAALAMPRPTPPLCTSCIVTPQENWQVPGRGPGMAMAGAAVAGALVLPQQEDLTS